MSHENVELVRRIYEEFWKGNVLSAAPDGIERAFRDYLDEQFEIRLPPDYPEEQLLPHEADRGPAPCGPLHGSALGQRSVERGFLDAGERLGPVEGAKRRRTGI